MNRSYSVSNSRHCQDRIALSRAPTCHSRFRPAALMSGMYERCTSRLGLYREANPYKFTRSFGTVFAT